MLLLFLITTPILLIIYLVYQSTKRFDYWKKKGVKYVKPIPIFGNMFPTVIKTQSMSELIQSLYNEFPDERYTGLFQFSTPIFLIKDPELIKSVTIKNFENFADHTGFLPAEADTLWDKGIFSSKGNRWRDLRQTLSPVFTSSKMRTMFVLMDECAHHLVSYFKEKNKNNAEVDLKDLFTRYTNDVIATTAFGIKCDSLKNENNDFLQAGRELSDLSGIKRFKFFLFGSYPRLCKWFNVKIITTKVGNFFKAIINETIIAREKNNIVRLDLIHFLMLARKGKLKFEDYTNLPEAGFAAVQETDFRTSVSKFMSNEDITAQALVFFLGGFDTVSSMMCFTGYELAVNPQIQAKLREEIKQIWLKAGEKISYEDLLGMKYLDMVICESLRKWSQAFFLDRVCTQEFVIEPTRPGEVPVKIEVGDVCWIPVHGLHNDPKFFQNPERFDPERFNDVNKEKIASGVYLPFGIGPRNCIGSRFALLETKILFFYLLLNFEFVPIEKTQIPLKLDKNNASLHAENGFHVGFKRVVLNN